ncbi:hypothetical protein THRCLA_01162 [Thraustotheca clavata]|uniref:WRKY19-like zinc finger domain-containing protein n=1 Tax=Thraustotheca clavata TaxID=74557 RepID=A0A1W0A939_9STRA|nr:hypothetical protein THRCLA_01162 [Thraustotheca clavata]
MNKLSLAFLLHSEEQNPIPNQKPSRSRPCKYPNCKRYAVTRGHCIAHGGGKRCSVDKCPSGAKSNGLCWKHGGSKTCSFPSCSNRSKTYGFCWSHGGGKQCSEDGCVKTALRHGLCWAHGGGKRCIIEGCQRPAYERNGNMCDTHCAATLYFYYMEQTQEKKTSDHQAIDLYQKGVEIAHSATTHDEHIKAIELISMAIAVRPGHARYFLARGNSFRAINDYDAAISDFNMALALDDKCATFYASRGTCYRKLSRSADALEDFTLAIEYDTKKGTHYFNRALVLYDINYYELAIADFTKALEDATGGPRTEFRALHSRGNCYRRLSQYEKCVEDMNQAIKLEPRNSIAYNSLAQCYMEYHDLDNAIKYFSTAISLLDSNPSYFNNRGQVYFEKGNEFYRMALADFHLAIKLDGKDANTYYNRGLTRMAVALQDIKAQENTEKIKHDHFLASDVNDDGEAQEVSRKDVPTSNTIDNAIFTGNMSIFEQLEAALADMDMACNCVPDSARYLFGKAMVMYLKHHPSSTHEFLTQALTIDPTHVASRYHTALLEHKNQQHESAIMAFTSIIDDMPDEPLFLAARALILQDIGLHEQAIEDYSRAIKLSLVPDARHVYLRGECHLRLGNFESTVSDCSLAIELGATDAGVFNARSLAHRGLGLYDKAIADLTSCIDINKHQSSFRLHRSICYLECHEYENAKKDLCMALKLTPHDPRLLYHAGMVAFYLQHYDEAIAFLRNALRYAPSSAYLSDIHYFLGLAQASLQDNISAIESFTNAIDTAHQLHINYYHERAKVLQLEHYYEEAIQDFNQVLSVNPTNAHALFRRGFAFKAIGKHVDAAQDLQKAKQLDPHDPLLMVNFKDLHDTECIVLCPPGHEKAY